MRAAIPRAGRRPTASQTQYLVLQACSTRYRLVRRLLQVRTVTFSCDSSRKWQSLWLEGENLERRWQGAPLCWRMLASVSEHHFLPLGTITHLRFTLFVKIKQSATGHAILPMKISPLSWWDKTYVLHIVLIYHDMKLMNALCLSHSICYWCIAGKASPNGDNFSLKCSLKVDSARGKCVYIVVSCLYTD